MNTKQNRIYGGCNQEYIDTKNDILQKADEKLDFKLPNSSHLNNNPARHKTEHEASHVGELNWCVTPVADEDGADGPQKMSFS